VTSKLFVSVALSSNSGDMRRRSYGDDDSRLHRVKFSCEHLAHLFSALETTSRRVPLGGHRAWIDLMMVESHDSGRFPKPVQTS